MPRHDELLARANNPKRIFARLGHEFKPQLAVLIVLVVLLFGSAAMSIMTPVVLESTISGLANFIYVQNGVNRVHWEALFGAFGIMVGLSVGSSLLGFVSDWIGNQMIDVFSYRLRKRLKAKLNKMPLTYFDTQSYGEILSKLTNDIDNINRNLYSIVNQVIQGAALLVGTTIAMFVSSWQLALVVLASYPLMIITVVLVGARSKKQYKKYRERYGKLEGMIEEDYAGYKIIKLFGEEENSQVLFDKINTEMSVADGKSQWISNFIFPIMRFIYLLGFVAISVVSGMITKNTSGIAQLAAFMVFLGMAQEPFQMLGQSAGTIQSCAAAAERVYGLLDAPEESPDSPNSIKIKDGIKGEVVFEHMSFSYTPEKPLIEDMNIHIKPGETVAIVGPTGAGKTTLVNLIMRFYDPNKGEIIVDGVPTTNYGRDAIRGSVGMVLQDTWLFAGSIKENIRYGNENASDDEIVKAAKMARADYFISTLPDGYDFRLSEDGTNISQGQRQLITIARAIVSKPKIMILDEATSSVDTRTEKAIQDALDDIMKNKTSFVIAHRLSTIKNAKVILVMNHGKIIETGTHEELLAKNGFYAEMYNSQFLGKGLDEATN
ncbi:MAG: ABC transporter ATP-binding protein/permease [Bacilli bacterium]|jgi:ATP-binding cassette subfamily B protein|nr:ABC transporter ATP-binding protein/permease [Bacilli bacterium]